MTALTPTARNLITAEKSLSEAGVDILEGSVEHCTIVGQYNNNTITVEVGGAGYCFVWIGHKIVTNMAQPFQVGRCVIEERHIGYFE